MTQSKYVLKPFLPTTAGRLANHTPRRRKLPAFASGAELFSQAAAKFGLGKAVRFSRGHPAGKSYQRIREFSAELICSARAQVPGLPHIHLGFIADRSVNAFAFKSDGRYFIALTSGTVFMLEFLFMRMFSDSRLFEHIGEPDEEADNLSPLSCCVPTLEEMIKAGRMPTAPRTLHRRRYASTLFEQAVLFLVGHEIAHITLGHVDYLQSKTSAALVAELGQNAVDPSALIERQCLEAHADMRAVLSRFASLQLSHANQNPAPAPWSARPLSEAHLIFLWAFAMNSLFQLFGDVRFNARPAAPESYPPLPLRRAMASVTAYAVVIDHWNSALKEQALHALRTAMTYAEHALGVIFGESASPKYGDDVFSSLGQGHHHQLMVQLLSLQGKLAPYSHEPAMSPERSHSGKSVITT
jgi:Peptidase family M48